MGILCDLFIATPKEALGFEFCDSPGMRKWKYAAVEFRGLTEVEFGKLLAIIEDKYQLATAPQLQAVSHGEESWLFKFPNRYVGVLASLDRDATDVLAEDWSEADGIMLDTDETRVIIEKLVQLAGRADKEKKHLYMWGSL